jgi:hypothetical protein
MVSIVLAFVGAVCTTVTSGAAQERAPGRIVGEVYDYR